MQPRIPAKNSGGGSALNGVFRAFCLAHQFSPVVVIVAIVIVLALLGGSVAFGISAVTNISGKVTSMGLKDIGELATHAGYYTNVQSIHNAQELWGWEIPFTQSKYIFSYDGVIKAGIDFGKVEWSANELTKTVTVTLPEVTILSNEVDDKSLKIFDETKNIFTPLSLDNINDARTNLKQEAADNAVQNGLLDNARANAELLIKGFLSGMYDAQTYRFEFK